MSSGIASANPGPVNHGSVERFDGSDATGPASAAESFTEFLENEAAPQPTPKPARKAVPEDGNGEGDEGQSPKRQPKRERQEDPDDADNADDPLRDPILDDEAGDDADDADEDDKDDADEDGDDADDDGEDDADDDPEHEVTVQGVRKSVKLSELIQGYSREADYRQKTAALSQDREEVENFATEVSAKAQTLDRVIQTYQDLITAVMPSKEEWAALKANNPQAYITAQEQWGKFAEAMEQAAADRETLNGEKSAEEQRQHQNYIKAENKKLLEKLPQLQDKKTAEKFSAAIFGYGKKMGYSAEEMTAGLINHRDVLTAYYASRYLEILESRKANQKQAKAGKPRVSEGNSNPRTVQTPKGRRVAANNREMRRADAQLARSGSVQDAGRAFAAMFRD